MRVGKIISVEYDKFRVKIFHSTRNSSLNIGGQVYYFGNIGSYLKVMNSLGEYVLCEVVSIVDRIEDENKIYGEFNLDSSREIIIKPIGTLMQKEFNMGIGVFPSLYSDVEIVTFEDLENVLMHQDNEKNVLNDNSCIDIGESKSLLGYKVKLDIDKFFNIHSAVLGNTGSGKSTTIAHIIQEIYQKKDPSARGAKTIIFDVNGEYPNAFGKEAKLDNTIETIFYKPNIKEGEDSLYEPFHLPYYLMNLDEWLSFLMASERTQKPFWDSVLQECYKFYKLLTSKETSDLEKFTNYIKWKLYRMLANILTRGENDTSKITAARGVIDKINSICNTIRNNQSRQDGEENIYDDLKHFLEICDKLCIINYGSNNESLSEALTSFVATEDSRIRKISISPLIDRNNNIYKYNVALDDPHNHEFFKQINENKAFEVEQNKLEPGRYFDSEFLKTAIEIVLLEEEARGNLHIREFVSTLMSRLDHFLFNPECEFMRVDVHDSTQDEGEGQNNNPAIYGSYDEYLERVFSISGNVNEKQLIIIDASEVGAETLELMTTVISRMIFDYRKRQNGEDRRKSPVHLILDEAHRYIHKDANYFMRENIFEKIAREGRKYAFYLIISSQRPSELSQTVLSQCGNYIVHRIQNKVDMDYVQSVLPYFSPDYVTKIKQAVPGEALIFGNCVPMPLLVKIKEADPTPNSENCKIREQWFNQQIENSAEETSQI